MNEIGEYLRQLRERRRMSLSQLAQCSGVSRRTLSYWEARIYQPRLPELESALAALGASSGERQQAFALLDAPRAERVLRTEANTYELEYRLGSMPSGGDLLRALRIRRGLQLEQVATLMGVTVSTVSRWENGKVTPSQESLEALFGHLGARSGERAALREGYLFLMAPLREIAPSRVLLQENFDAFMLAHSVAPDDRLDQLRFLSFEAQAWLLASRSASGQRLLANICAHYSAFLAAGMQAKEAGRYAYRALDLFESDPGDEETKLRAAIISAQAEVYRGTRPTPARGLKILESWRGCAGIPRMKAWLLSDMAEYLALEAEWEASLRLHQEACYLAESASSPEDLRFRKIDMAKVAIQAGQAESALSLVTLSAHDFPSRRARIELLFAEALIVLNERNNAHTWLERARSDITASDLIHLQNRLDALTHSLEL